MNTKNCFIGQSGGPTVAINASLAGIITQCQKEGFTHIYGMINGIQGLLEDHFMDLGTIFNSEEKIDALKHSPAMYLGSCRYKLPTVSDDKATYDLLFKKFNDLEITDFFYIGGNDSMDTVAKLAAYGETINSPIHFIGIPKTIDNDLMGTDHTPGFGSAAKYVASSMLEIAYDSSIYKLDAITIVEIMGRNAGWLTAASALARTECNDAPDLIYLPEVVFDKERFLKDIEEKFKEKSSIMIAVSEGIHDENGNFLDSGDSQQYDAFGHPIHFGTGKVLENICKEHFGCKVRSIELNVLQRCAMHIASKTDIQESKMLGMTACRCALQGKSGLMASVERLSSYPYQVRYTAIPVCEVSNQEKKVPDDYINEAGNDVTEKMMEYLKPLIHGETEVIYENGIPKHLYLY